MGLSRMIKACRECAYRDTCENKKMEALGYLSEPLAAFASAPLNASASADVMVKRDYRDIKVAEDMTITIDLEDVKKQLERDHYKHLYAGLMMGGC